MTAAREVAAMRFTVCVLGLTLLDVEVTESTAPEDEWTDCGTTSSTVVGFTASHDLPDEVGLPQRWGDDEC